MRRLLSGSLPSAAAALFFALAPVCASADQHEAGEAAGAPVEWDQARMTELADSLATAVHGLRNTARRMPPDTIASGQAHARMNLIDELRLIERESRALHTELEEGRGRDETLPIFRRIDGLRRSAGEEARRMFFPQATLEQIQNARAIIEEMRPYYGGRTDARPDLHGPTKEAE